MRYALFFVALRHFGGSDLINDQKILTLNYRETGFFPVYAKAEMPYSIAFLNILSGPAGERLFLIHHLSDTLSRR